MPAPAIVWFRNDLRIADNPALIAAARLGPVIPLYILDDAELERPLGGASRWWLDKSLRSLSDDLSKLGAPLVLRRGDPLTVLESVVAETGAGSVHWNRLYDPESVRRDSLIKARLTDRNIRTRSFNGSLIFEPWDIKTAAGGAYKVFTPYWRAARPLVERVTVEPGPTRLVASPDAAASDRIDDWGLHPRAPDWSTGFGDWTPGEQGATVRLTAFLQGPCDRYQDRRNTPGESGTSRLSPHLRFGELSPRQICVAARERVPVGEADSGEIDGFLRQIGWREFNQHLIFHFPDMEREGFNPRFRHFPWRNDPEGAEAWRHGRTGFPIVDAGMRELWATGWMHNRVRMIVASFLVKDLLIDWRVGESWFWDTLLDADLANNVAGWQWVAGSGADAAPYFRIFNPVLQGEKFDPEGDYVRRWLPELDRLPNNAIHKPWRADKTVLSAAGVRLNVTYPLPIIDHALARDRALAAYENLA